ncbi:MAG: sigma-70 family RNA polymerase sigma factor [Sedimentisphaerales bacterium]|nr:sigma-70 family RNA polymerase sigma factor [Sedimentisphaerales bacterium]
MNTFTNEIDLLNASLSGNKEAFGTIVENYQSLVCSITYSATGDFAKSEELAQETFIQAWKELKQLKDLGKFRAWLCTITRNLLRQSIRKQSKDVIDSAQPIENAAASETSKTQPDQIAISKEQQTVIWQALQEIPETYREPMVLFYREEQSIKQVAAQLELSAEVTKQRLSRGRKLLKAEMSTLVEDILGKTSPKKAFTIAVVAALPALTPQVASAAILSVAAKGSAAAKFAAYLSVIGAFLGPLLGLLGSIIGTKANIDDSKSLREYEFMKKRAYFTLLFIFIGLTIILILNLTNPGSGIKFLSIPAVFIISFSAVFYLIHLSKQKRKDIQIEDGTYVKPDKRIKTNGQIYSSFAGGIYGFLSWAYLISVQAKDWFILLFLSIIGVLIYIVSIKICLRYRQYYNFISVGTYAVIGLINLLVVNLRWKKWVSMYGEKHFFSNHSLREVNFAICAVIAVLVLGFLITELYQRTKSINRQKEST